MKVHNKTFRTTGVLFDLQTDLLPSACCFVLLRRLLSHITQWSCPSHVPERDKDGSGLQLCLHVAIHLLQRVEVGHCPASQRPKEGHSGRTYIVHLVLCDLKKIGLELGVGLDR